MSKHEESNTQCAFVEWCRLHERKYPALKLGYAIPNGGKRNVITASILKREGARAGVPDWCLPVARRGYAGLWIEFKSKTGKLSASQEEYIALLEVEGHVVFVCRSVDEAIAAVEFYLKG